LVAREPGPFVEVHPEDAADHGVVAGMTVELTSRRGVLRLPLRVNAGLPRGLVFVPFHWGDEYGQNTAANYVTISAIGRVAKQPELKYCAVHLAPASAPPRRPRTAPLAVLGSGTPSDDRT
jgi:anaerobic selenocysteine-containing dehydrogenase